MRFGCVRFCLQGVVQLTPDGGGTVVSAQDPAPHPFTGEAASGAVGEAVDKAVDKAVGG